MKLLYFLSPLFLLGVMACNGKRSPSGGKGDNPSETVANCTKSGSMANFTITCTHPIESYKTGNITMSPQKQKMTLNGVEVTTSNDNKIITGKDAGSGMTSMTWELTLKGGKVVTLTIP